MDINTTGTIDAQLGFWGAVSISVGGMIGCGVFAVLGVVATVAEGSLAVESSVARNFRSAD